MVWRKSQTPPNRLIEEINLFLSQLDDFCFVVSMPSTEPALRKSPGATFQCYPLSVMTVTDFLL